MSTPEFVSVVVWIRGFSRSPKFEGLLLYTRSFDIVIVKYSDDFSYFGTLVKRLLTFKPPYLKWVIMLSMLHLTFDIQCIGSGRSTRLCANRVGFLSSIYSELYNGIATKLAICAPPPKKKLKSAASIAYKGDAQT